MREFRVGHAIDVRADTAATAAEAARIVQARAVTIARVFIVAERLSGSHRYGLPVEVELGPCVAGDLADWRKLTELHPSVDWATVRLIIDATTGQCPGCGRRVLDNQAASAKPAASDLWPHESVS